MKLVGDRQRIRGHRVLNFIYDFKTLCLFVTLFFDRGVPAELEETFSKDRRLVAKNTVDAE